MGRGRGRGRGKGKKQSAMAAVISDGAGKLDDEKLLMRRRGRPQKPTKDSIKEEAEVEKMEEENLDEDVENAAVLALTKSTKNQTAVENGRTRKRKRQPVIKDGAELVTEENGLGSKNSNGTALIKLFVGYRQNGRQRKNKPRRAAESVVECK